MAGYAIEQLLGYVYLTGVIETVKTGIPDVLPPEFFTLKKETIRDSGRYTQYAGTRQTSRRVEYGAGAVMRALSPVSVRDVKLFHSFEHINLDPLLYQALRGYDTYENDKGAEELTRQVGQFRALFDNNRLATVYSLLGLGALNWDKDGNFLPSSSSSVVSVSYGLPANNLNQLNGIISQSWADPQADIPGMIRALKKQSWRDTGYVLKHAFYGSNIPSYVYQNVQAREYLARNVAMNTEYMDTGEMPDGFQGLQWWPMGEGAFFVDQNSANQELFSADQVTFTPEINQETYEWMEGSYEVPTTFNPFDTAQGAMGSFAQVHGMFSFALPVFNPVTVQLFYGDTCLPIWKIINNMYLATTVY